ncbi:MAG: ABC transporter permease [Candidatus Poseidoniaceae archaeon]
MMDEKQVAAPALRPIGVKSNPFLAPVHTISEVRKNRFLVRNLIRREIRGRYRNAALGYAWTVIEPALLASVYWFLFIMLSGNPDEMYAVWVLIGVIVWSCFSKSLNAATNSLTKNMRTIHLVYFPRSIFPVSGVGANIVVTLMSCMVILPIIYIYDMPITVHMIWIPLGVMMAGFMALGLGMMMAPLNCVNRDVEHLVRFITRAGFFVSPVMWTAEMAMERGAWGEAALWNPMVVPITMVRHGLEGRIVELPYGIIVASIVASIVFYLIGSIVFSRYERGAVKYL